MSDLVENEVVSSPNVQEPVVVQEPVSTPEPTVVRPVQEVRSFETVNTDSYNSIKLDPLFKKVLCQLWGSKIISKHYEIRN